MRRIIGFALLIAVGSCSHPGAEDRTVTKPGSESPLVLRERDAAAPLDVRLGQTIEVRLESDPPTPGRAPAAWEFESLKGNALKPLEGPAATALLPGDGKPGSPANIFVFRYRTVQAGEAKLQFDYVWPAGPNERRRTVRIRAVTFTIVVAAN
jgi:hypothetical protein